MSQWAWAVWRGASACTMRLIISALLLGSVDLRSGRVHCAPDAVATLVPRPIGRREGWSRLYLEDPERPGTPFDLCWMIETPTSRGLTHLSELESEAIFIMREVAAEFERPVVLFSGGKDSIVLLRLAEKAFRPARFPFPIMHVDTGHNFPEVLEFRDRRVAELGERLIVASVQESIDKGRVR